MEFLNAQRSYAVANAPLFLLEQLRSDPDIKAIAASTPPRIIYEKIVSSLAHEPKSLKDLVTPYAYLVALAMSGDIALLRKASLLPSERLKWFRYLADVSILEATPTTVTMLSIKSKPAGRSEDFTSTMVTTANTQQVIDQSGASIGSNAPAAKIKLG